MPLSEANMTITIMFLLWIVYFCVSKNFLKKIEIFLIFSLLQINFIFIFLDHFDVLISKIIFKK
jgi:hypothetical protein